MRITSHDHDVTNVRTDSALFPTTSDEHKNFGNMCVSLEVANIYK